MKKLAGTLLAGLSATYLMDEVSSYLYKREPEAVRQREEELSKGMPTTVLARKVASALGTELEGPQADRAGMLLHYFFGAGGGPAAALLVRLGASPLKAGLATGMAMFVFVDEGFNTVAGLAAPPREYPLVTHARALANHVAYGVVVGLLLEAGGE